MFIKTVNSFIYIYIPKFVFIRENSVFIALESVFVVQHI